ncbi:MAG TPA: prephenate dehydrogenase [Phycisphaerae bacterium]|nr:prephenate dehydrogenase [Phycisphaerae bacterium]HOQ87359.1 prephenate dehydrogenase [Phycisphaerae bacterium]HQE29578.1 prephenate dehydrogenase [Phycisphaerae bacterium]
MNINRLDRIAIAGVGLLGGSIGHALRAAGFAGTRVGIGRRASSLEAAVACDAVDEVTLDVEAGVRGAGLVVLCTPLGQMEQMFRRIAPVLKPGTYVTDVGSTKAGVVRMAQRLLPPKVRFVGSHPMAGSEKTGVEFARADLFDRALCIVTPTARTPSAHVRWMRGFWESMGATTTVLDPRKHDVLLARVSHLPHAVATALVHLSKDGAIDVAGPGFADATRIASGDPDMWTDILRTNRAAMIRSIDRLVAELNRLRSKLDRDDADALRQWLAAGKQVRDEWIALRYRKKVLPP